MKKHALTILAYVVATFVTQALSHFLIAADHYSALTYLRPDPIFPLGILSMLIQGTVLSVLYPKIQNPERPFRGALVFSWLMGSFLVSYIALAEPAKYTIPAIPSWIAVEAAAGFVQFSVFGLLLGVLHRPARVPK